jgi:Domain of unknown function (DUF5011)/Bacterial pre-peptidase C-terminal domain
MKKYIIFLVSMSLIMLAGFFIMNTLIHEKYENEFQHESNMTLQEHVYKVSELDYHVIQQEETNEFLIPKENVSAELSEKKVGDVVLLKDQNGEQLIGKVVKSDEDEVVLGQPQLDDIAEDIYYKLKVKNVSQDYMKNITFFYFPTGVIKASEIHESDLYEPKKYPINESFFDGKANLTGQFVMDIKRLDFLVDYNVWKNKLEFTFDYEADYTLNTDFVTQLIELNWGKGDRSSVSRKAFKMQGLERNMVEAEIGYINFPGLNFLGDEVPVTIKIVAFLNSEGVIDVKLTAGYVFEYHQETTLKFDNKKGFHKPIDNSEIVKSNLNFGIEASGKIKNNIGVSAQLYFLTIPILALDVGFENNNELDAIFKLEYDMLKNDTKMCSYGSTSTDFLFYLDYAFKMRVTFHDAEIIDAEKYSRLYDYNIFDKSYNAGAYRGYELNVCVPPDKRGPEIIFTGDIILQKGTDLDEEMVKRDIDVRDNENDGLIKDLKVEGIEKIDTKRYGKYSILYSVVDYHGNETKKERDLWIIDTYESLIQGDQVYKLELLDSNDTNYNKVLNLDALIFDEGDVDYYQFHVPKDQYAIINLPEQPYNSQVNYDLELYDLFNNRLDRSNHNGNEEEIIKYLERGDYLVKVYSQNGFDRSTPYELGIKLQNNQKPVIEVLYPNDEIAFNEDIDYAQLSITEMSELLNIKIEDLNVDNASITLIDFMTQEPLVTSKPGYYTIDLQVIDELGLASDRMSLQIYLNDITAPELIFDEWDLMRDYPNLLYIRDGVLYVREGQGITPMPFKRDNYDSSIDIELTVDQTSPPSQSGEYVITYTAIDSSKNITIEKKTFVVVDPFELNDSLEDATPIGLITEDIKDLEGTIHQSNDEDYYQFTIEKEGYITSQLIKTPLKDPMIDYDITLYDHDGKYITSSTKIPDLDSTLNFDDRIIKYLEAGDYYLKIYSKEKADAKNCYKIILKYEENTVPILILEGKDLIEVPVHANFKDFDPGFRVSDDFPNKAQKIYPDMDTSHLGTFTIIYKAIDEGGLEGIITRTVRVVDKITPTMIFDEQDMKANYPDLLYMDGDILYVKEDARVTPKPMATDNYWGIEDIVITPEMSSPPSQTGEYSMSYTATDGSGNSSTVNKTIVVVDRQENNDEDYQLGSITKKKEVEGTIHDISDVDYYEFIIEENGYIDIYLLGANYQDPNTDYDIELYDSNRHMLAESNRNTDSNDSRSLRETIIEYVEAGTYYLKISSKNLFDTKTLYTLTFEYKENIAPVLNLDGDNPLVVPLNANLEDYEPDFFVFDRFPSTAQRIYPSLDTSQVGYFTVTYKAIDEGGLEGTITRTIHVVDLIAPTMIFDEQIMKGNYPDLISMDGDILYVKEGARVTPKPTAIDNYYGMKDIIITPEMSSPPSQVGEYTMTYTAIDGSGNTSTVIKTIVVVDPYESFTDEFYDISTYGQVEATIHEPTDEDFYQFTLARAGYVDINLLESDYEDPNTDYDIALYDHFHNMIAKSDNTTDSNESRSQLEQIIEYLEPGKYYIKINSKNLYDINTFYKITYVFKENESPEISLKGANPLEIPLNSDFKLQDPGISVDDDFFVTKVITTVSDLDTSKVGSFIVTYRAIDEIGAQSTLTRIVKIVDQTAPNFVFDAQEMLDNYPNLLYIKNNILYVKEGLIPLPSARDNYYTTGNIIVKAESIYTPSQIGEYTITYTATDASQNQTSTEMILVVVDRYETNEQMDDAWDMSAYNQIQGSIHHFSDVDYYRFTMEKKGYLDIDLLSATYDDPNTDYDLEFYDATGQIMASSRMVTDPNDSRSLQENMYLFVEAGDYYIKVFSKNHADLDTLYTITVNFVANTAPNLRLNGDNPLVIPVKSSFSQLDPSVSVYDTNKHKATITTSYLNTHVIGTYTVTYVVTDEGGLQTSITREVQIVDQTAPNLRFDERDLMYDYPNVLEVDGSIIYMKEGRSAIPEPYIWDNYDKFSNLTLSTTGFVDPDRIGNYTMTYTVSDQSGNTRQEVITYIIGDRNENNDNRTTAWDLGTLKSGLTGWGTIHRTSDVDYFKFNVSSSKMVTITLPDEKFDTYQVNYDITLYNNEGMIIETSTRIPDYYNSSKGNDFITRHLSAGDYYIKVYSSNSFDVDTLYELTIN